MREILINPNKPRTRHDELAWLERDGAAIHHFDCDGSPDFPEGNRTIQSAPTPQHVADASVTGTRMAELFKPYEPPHHEPAPVKTFEQSSDPRPEESKAAADIAPSVSEHPPVNASIVGKAAGDSPMPPLLASFFSTMPIAGSAWSCAERMDWLRAAESIFHLVYKTEGRIRIETDKA